MLSWGGIGLIEVKLKIVKNFQTQEEEPLKLLLGVWILRHYAVMDSLSYITESQA